MSKDSSGNKHNTVTVNSKTIVVENQVFDGKIVPDATSQDTTVTNRK